ncbi:MAG: LacI family DNA-binding transcriptional regulator [Clostridia bacterium]|nr:LacI family DNA-binding transcriptional regulator [Clostridia bacterium]
MKKVTVYDLAKACGYSVSTVSKAVSGNKTISEETRKYIEEKAREIGYYLNVDNTLATEECKRIAVIYPERPLQLVEVLEEGILQAKEKYGICNIELVPLKYSYESKFDGKHFAEEYDGVVYYPVSTDRILIEDIEKLADKIPVSTVAAISEYFENVFNVMIDAYELGECAADIAYLITGKNNEAGIISGLSTQGIHNENIRGFRAGAQHFGFVVKEVYYTDDSYKMIYESTEIMIKKNPDIKVLFVSTSLALAAYDALSKNGRSDVGIIAVDATKDNIRALAEGKLSVIISQNNQKQMRTAIEYVARRILHLRGVSKEFRENIIRPKVILRNNVKYYI